MNHLRYANLSQDEQEQTLREIIQTTPVLWRTLEVLRELNLTDSWIVSGALYNQVWNRLTGKPDMYGVKDIDIFYRDDDTSYEAEDRIIKAGERLFAADPPVEIRNQARVPLWYKDHFGHDYPSVSSCKESISLFASETHCVAVRLIGNEDDLEVFAPYGLNSVFSMILVPNNRQPNKETHEKKGRRQKSFWPELQIIP
jgi:uncharacterized protein